MKEILPILVAIISIMACHTKPSTAQVVNEKQLPGQFIVVLGIAQDAGYPQIGCTKECCKAYWNGKEEKKHITSLALVDRTADKYWLFEATPDVTVELHNLQPYLVSKNDYAPDGIFLTHAHIGHYSGLMQFGREAMGAKEISVWAMPRMDSFIRNNGPWSQLVSLKNIRLQQIKEDSTVSLNTKLMVTPVRVPHRDEYSETVGFIISGSHKKILFIPDIDKWQKWNKSIVDEIKKVDMALIDGTFYKNGELPGRDMSEVPHPFVAETIQLLSSLPASEKAKIRFIHFNHTNPLLKLQSPEKDNVKAKGFTVAEEGMIFEL